MSNNKASDCFQFIVNTTFDQYLKLQGEDVVKMEAEEKDSNGPTRKKPRKIGNLLSTLAFFLNYSYSHQGTGHFECMACSR